MRDYQNIYQSARDGAGLTQECAAELLGLSTKSIQCIEAGKQNPSPVTVASMARVYRAPWLRNHYCNNCPLGRHIQKPEQAYELQQFAIEAQLEFADNDQQMRDAKRLLEISLDHRIDEREVDDYRAIVKRMMRRANLAEVALMVFETKRQQ